MTSSNLIQINKIGSSKQFVPKIPNLKNLIFQNTQIDKLIITTMNWDNIMSKLSNLTSQFYQFQSNWTKTPKSPISSPRISNSLKHTNLIKLNHINSLDKVSPQKPIILLRKKEPKINPKLPKWKLRKYPKYAWKNAWNLKINAKGGAKMSYRPWEREMMQKVWRKTPKTAKISLTDW